MARASATRSGGVRGRRASSATPTAAAASSVSGGRRGVPSARRFPGEALADREQGGPGAARPRPGGGVVTGRRRPEAEPRLRLRQNRERAAVAIVLEPRLTHEQATRAIVATGVELGLGTFHDERGVEPGLAGRRREQRLRRVPRPARESERFGALGRDVGRGLLSRGDGPRRRRRDQKQETDRPLHCRRRCCATTRWYSARESGVSRKRPNPVLSWKKSVSRNPL